MVNIRSDPTITIEKDASRIILSIEEAQQVKQQLDAFLAQYAGYTVSQQQYANTQSPQVQASSSPPATNNQPILKQLTASSSSSSTSVHMSEDKKKQLKDHVLKKLTAEPQSLTTLLKGVSYVPNYLPFIRDMIEQDDNIGVHAIGKRATYYKKAHNKEAKTAS